MVVVLNELMQLNQVVEDNNNWQKYVPFLTCSSYVHQVPLSGGVLASLK